MFGEDPLDYDFILNMPKLKTHVMMGLTAGVKNLFGFVPSLGQGEMAPAVRGRQAPFRVTSLGYIHYWSDPG